MVAYELYLDIAGRPISSIAFSPGGDALAVASGHRVSLPLELIDNSLYGLQARDHPTS